MRILGQVYDSSTKYIVFYIVFNNVPFKMYMKYYSLLTDNSSIFSSKSEASASDLLENIEEMFPRYYLYSDV